VRVTILIHLVLSVAIFLFGIMVAYVVGIPYTLALRLLWPAGLWLAPILAALTAIGLLAAPIGYHGGRRWYLAGFAGLAAAYVYNWQGRLVEYTLLLLGLALAVGLGSGRLRSWLDVRLNRPLRRLPESGFGSRGG
jgi:hypothetical protein